MTDAQPTMTHLLLIDSDLDNKTVETFRKNTKDTTLQDVLNLSSLGSVLERLYSLRMPGIVFFPLVLFVKVGRFCHGPRQL
jgi:hypothetical protein